MLQLFFSNKAGRFLWPFLLAWGFLVLTFLILPLLIITPLSFNSGAFLVFPLEGLSLRWYEAILTDNRWITAAKNSLIIGFTATSLALAIGIPAALAIGLYKFRAKPVVSTLAGMPLVVPPVILAIGLFFALSAVGLTNTLSGIIIAHAVLGLPFVVITIAAALQAFDVTLLRAGASLGASPLRVFRTVTLPLLLPSVITGGLLAFITSFDEVVTVIFLGGPGQRTLPREMFDSLRESINPSILAVATILTVISTLLMVVALRAMSRAGGGQLGMDGGK